MQTWNGAKFLLALILVIGSNGWLATTLTARAQTAPPQSALIDDQSLTEPQTLSPTVARDLLDQLQSAVSGIRDDKQRAYALIAIAQNYSQLSEQTTAEQLLYEALQIADEISSPVLVNRVLGSIDILSDKTVTYELVNQILDLVEGMENNQQIPAILADIVFYADDFSPSQSVASDLIAQTVTMANDMPTGEARFQTLWLLASAHYQRSDKVAAIGLVYQALDELSLSEDDNTKLTGLFLLHDLVKSLAGDITDNTLLDQLLAVANTLQDEASRAYFWANSVTLVEQTANPNVVADLLNRSLAVANTIEEDGEKANLLVIIAKNYSQLTKFDHLRGFSQQLYQAILEIQDSVYQRHALVNMVNAAAADMTTQTGLSQAVAVANNLEDSWSKAHGLITAARSYAQRAEQGIAQNLLNQALAAVNLEQYNYSHEQVFLDFVNATKMLSEDSQQPLLANCLSVVKQIQDAEAQSYLLLAMADTYGEDDKATANALIEMALSTVETISDDQVRASGLHRALWALTVLASDTSTAVDEKNTFQLLQQVLAYTDGLETIIANTGFFNSFAHITLKLSNERYIEQLLTQLLAIANHENTPDFEVGVSAAIANIYAVRANETAAQDWLNRTLTAGRQIEHEGGRMATMAGMAQISYLLSDGNAVHVWLDDWLSITAAMEHSHTKGSGINIIAAAANRLADEATVRSLVTDVVAIAATIDDEAYRADALRSMASAVTTMALGKPN